MQSHSTAAVVGQSLSHLHASTKARVRSAQKRSRSVWRDTRKGYGTKHLVNGTPACGVPTGSPFTRDYIARRRSTAQVGQREIQSTKPTTPYATNNWHPERFGLLVCQALIRLGSSRKTDSATASLRRCLHHRRVIALLNPTTTILLALIGMSDPND